MTQVLISLGSNIDQERNIRLAIKALDRQSYLELVSVSSVYASQAIGRDGRVADQPSFYNAAVLVETSLSATELRQALRIIEAELGRVRNADKFAPRPIDLDIALFGEDVLDLDGSKIPDEDIVRHAHVAIPIAELCPLWVHPQTGQTLDQIAGSLETREMEIVPYEDAYAR